MNTEDIKKQSDSKSKARADRQNIRAKLYKVEGNKIIYTVTSSEGNKQYLVTIMLLGLTGDKLDSLKSALNDSVKISCTCPAFLYRGFKYITWHKNVGINRETRSPDITNPNKEGMACKHILVAFDQMKSDYNEIYNMLKDQIKSTTNNKSSNTNNDSPSESDIKAITEFSKACHKLYSDYTKFKKEDEDGSFVDSKYYDKVDPSAMLKDISKQAAKSLSGKFIGKLKSLDDILKTIDQKKNGFNVLLDSDVSSLIKKLNEIIKSKTEALINDIILDLMFS